MKNYLVNFTDEVGNGKTIVKTVDPENAGHYVMNQCAWGRTVINWIDEINVLENNYVCYTRVFTANRD